MSKSKRESLGTAFNRLWAASLASNISDGLFKTSVPLLAATLTRDPIQIATLGAIVMLPWLIFAIPIGTIVDRVERRRALALANSLRFLAVAFLCASILGNWISIPALYLVAFVVGAAEVLYDTTSHALIPTLVKAKNLERANSRLEVGGLILGELIGSPLSAILYAIAIAIPFVSGNIGIGLALILVLLIPKPKQSEISKQKTKVSMLSDMKFGIRYLYEDKTLLKLVLFTTAIGFWFSTTSSTMVLFLLDVLKVPTAAFGIVMLAGALGSILGGVTAPKISGKFGRMNIMSMAIVGSGLITLVTGFAPNIYFWIVLQVIGGFAISIWNILLMSTYHQIIPNELFGRIHGTRRTLVWGMMPIGSLVGGLLAKIDLRAPLIVGGTIAALIAIFGIPFVCRLATLVSDQQPS